MCISKWYSLYLRIMKSNFLVLLVALLVTVASGLRQKRSDGLRCRLTNGFMCKWSCRSFGHSDGKCDENDDCKCSEESLDNYVCGGYDDDSFPEAAEALADEKTADTICAGFCQFKGRQTGKCNLDKKSCECSAARLGLGHAKCATDEVCSMYCQIKERKASGKCEGEHGWDCVCTSSNDEDEVDEKDNDVNVDGDDDDEEEETEDFGA